MFLFCDIKFCWKFYLAWWKNKKRHFYTVTGLVLSVQFRSPVFWMLNEVWKKGNSSTPHFTAAMYYLPRLPFLTWIFKMHQILMMVDQQEEISRTFDFFRSRIISVILSNKCFRNDFALYVSKSIICRVLRNKFKSREANLSKWYKSVGNLWKILKLIGAD